MELAALRTRTQEHDNTPAHTLLLQVFQYLGLKQHRNDTAIALFRDLVLCDFFSFPRFKANMIEKLSATLKAKAKITKRSHGYIMNYVPEMF